MSSITKQVLNILKRQKTLPPAWEKEAVRICKIAVKKKRSDWKLLNTEARFSNWEMIQKRMIRKERITAHAEIVARASYPSTWGNTSCRQKNGGDNFGCMFYEIINSLDSECQKIPAPGKPWERYTNLQDLCTYRPRDWLPKEIRQPKEDT